jgi:regulatory protein
MASDDKSVEIAAVRLLARREHGTQELKRKLAAKGHDADAIERVVEKLGAKQLVSDDRFVAVFVHHHAKRGQGPVRIRAELRQQGIPDDSIERALLHADLEWDQLAAQVRRRKFAASPPKTLAGRAKQSRFLQYRGFTADQIRTALAGEGGDQASSDQPDSLDSDWSD